jgi:DNA mismatch repair ATPase MutS
MHMRTQVDEEKREVTFLYKLIDGKAESSHGTRACLPPSLALAHTIDRR